MEGLAECVEEISHLEKIKKKKDIELKKKTTRGWNQHSESK